MSRLAQQQDIRAKRIQIFQLKKKKKKVCDLHAVEELVIKS